MAHKGSRKHILDLIDSDDFLLVLNNLLQPYNTIITENKTVQPKGSKDTSEYGLQSFIDKNNLSKQFPSLTDFNFNTWWNSSGGKAPTWDMISLCQLNGKDAILLVEAKAHKSEFNRNGKRLPKDKPSGGSSSNQENIEKCISDACSDLNSTNTGFNLSIKSHYQLSNRVAFAWQLSQRKVPVVLLYLGFTGDTYFRDYFKDDFHWKNEFDNYIEGVIPINFINKKDSDFLFIHASLAIKE